MSHHLHSLMYSHFIIILRVVATLGNDLSYLSMQHLKVKQSANS